VSLDPNRRDCSGGSDDHARRDYLKLGAPVKQDGPIYGDVEPLSDRQRPVGSEAETGAAHVDSATGPTFSRNTMAYDAVPNLEAHRKAGTATAVGVESFHQPYPPYDPTIHYSKFGARPAFGTVRLVMVNVLLARPTG